MTRALAVALVASAVVAGLAGCATTPQPSTPELSTPALSASAPSGPTLPPRPREIRMDGLDPCTLMPPEVLRQVGVPATPQAVPDTAPGARSCSWDRSVLQRPSGGLGVFTVTNQDVRNVLSVRGAEVTTVAGFGAVEIPSGTYGAEFTCDVRVDVAPNQGLWVTYLNTLGDEPGATHELMCRRAHTAAEAIMQRLLATTR